MFDFTKYDFSKESSFKDALFRTMIKIFEKSRKHVIELSDDELDGVAAAGRIYDQQQCPFTDRRCKDCENYIGMDPLASCSKGYFKM